MANLPALSFAPQPTQHQRFSLETKPFILQILSIFKKILQRTYGSLMIVAAWTRMNRFENNQYKYQLAVQFNEWMSESPFTGFRYHSIIKLAPILIEWLSISSIVDCIPRRQLWWRILSYLLIYHKIFLVLCLNLGLSFYCYLWNSIEKPQVYVHSIHVIFLQLIFRFDKWHSQAVSFYFTDNLIL